MSAWGQRESTIGLGHDGKPTTATPDKPGEQVHHTPSGSTNATYAAPHVGAPKRHLAVPVHSAMAGQIKPGGDGLTGRGHATSAISDGGVTVNDNSRTVDALAKPPAPSFKEGRLSPTMPGMRSRTDPGGVEGIRGRLPGSPGFDDCGS